MNTPRAKMVLDNYCAFEIESGDAANEVDDFVDEFDNDFEGITEEELIDQFNEYCESFAY